MSLSGPLLVVSGSVTNNVKRLFGFHSVDVTPTIRHNSTAAVVRPMSTTDVWRCITDSTDPLNREYSQLGQSASICDVSKQPTRTLYMWKNRNDNKQEI